jgi:arylsulfate sulfotransferase
MVKISPRFAGILVVLLYAAGCSSPTTNISIAPQSTFVGSGQNAQFTANLTGGNPKVTWLVNGVVGGTAATGTIDANGDYSAPSVTQNATATVTARIGNGTNPGQTSSAAVSIVAPGVVTTTNEPQVAQYTIDPPASANVSIEFGTDTTYGKTTWTQAAPTGGGPVSIYVAGMLANTPYHMRAVIQFDGGNTVDDSDHTFTTSAFPAAEMPTLSTSTTAGMAPQSGVELLDFFDATQTSKVAVAVTDLDGNLLWGYAPNLVSSYGVDPVKLMPNGDFLINYSSAATVDGGNSLLQEVDLGGNVVWSMTSAQLNAALANATCAGCNITVVGTHHDFAILPNGHLIVIAAQQQVINGVTVTGDVLIDLDQNHQPVWLWNEFDHLDLARRPMGWPDWTHTNAVVYSPDDKDLIVSLRHQHWVIKIDYNDGQGTGSILWRLGYQGDFTLMNGTDPVDWQYAQHDANVMSSNSSGVFQMTMVDNGNNRVLSTSGDTCGGGTTPPCWSRIPVYQLDEAQKTATLEWVDDLSPVYSFWGGTSRLLANGNIEFDECGLTNASAIYEVTETTPPQTVWQMQITGQNAYRATRIPSFYPGVQW